MAVAEARYECDFLQNHTDDTAVRPPRPNISGSGNPVHTRLANIAAALQNWIHAPAQRPGDDMNPIVLQKLREHFAKTNKFNEARQIELLKEDGPSLSTDSAAGEDISIDLNELADLLETVMNQSRPNSPFNPDNTNPATGISSEANPDGPHPFDARMCQDLNESSRQAHITIHNIIENEPDPDKQWSSIVEMMQAKSNEPIGDVEINLSDSSYLYSR